MSHQYQLMDKNKYFSSSLSCFWDLFKTIHSSSWVSRWRFLLQLVMFSQSFYTSKHQVLSSLIKKLFWSYNPKTKPRISRQFRFSSVSPAAQNRRAERFKSDQIICDFIVSSFLLQEQIHKPKRIEQNKGGEWNRGRRRVVMWLSGYTTVKLSLRPNPTWLVWNENGWATESTERQRTLKKFQVGNLIVKMCLP